MDRLSAGQVARLRELVARAPLLFAVVIILNVLASLAEAACLIVLAPLLSRASSPAASGGSLSEVPLVGLLVTTLHSDTFGGLLVATAGLLAGAAMVRGLLVFLRNYFARRLELSITMSLRTDTFEHMLRMPLLSMRDQSMSRVVNVLVSFAPESAAVAGRLALGVSALVQAGVYFAMSLVLSWQLATLGLALLWLCSWSVQRMLRKPIERGGAQINEHAISVNQTVYDAVNGMLLVRAMSREDDMIQCHRRKLSDYIAATLRQGGLQALVDPLLTTSVLCIVALILALGGMLMSAEDDPGRLLLLLMMLTRLLGPASNLNEARSFVAAYASSVRQVFDFLHEERAYISDGRLNVSGLSGDIRFQNVVFRYPGVPTAALCGVDLVIPRNKTTAIVGPSGSGKTTFLHLLMRLFDPQDGRIIVSGADLRDLRLIEWRRTVGLVPQDSLLFSGSIRDNITFNKPAATTEEIVTALRLANADAFVGQQPQGLDTFIGERGAKLSGGQQQRLSIARAVLSDPDIILLDEATSNLDSESEAAIQDAIASLARTKTIIAVAHRLTTVRAADMIVVMEAGHIAEVGTHDELMRRQGLYHRLFAAQFERDREPASTQALP